MNYKIYQAYYKEEQKKFLNPEFVSFDNTSNKRPDLMEYYIFNVGYKKAVSERLSHWGFFSWKWEKKCRIKPQKFIDFIDKNPNQDVYIINWTPYYESINWNIWTHGEFCHPGLFSVAVKCLKEMGYDSRILYHIMPRNVLCFSSYFVASKKFWVEYLEFLKKFKNVIDNNQQLKQLIDQKTVHIDQSLINTNHSFFPFIIERMFSTFLLLNYRQYSICNYSDNFKIYEKYVGDSYKDIERCSDLKMKIWKEMNNFNQDDYVKLWEQSKNKLINIKQMIPDC